MMAGKKTFEMAGSRSTGDEEKVKATQWEKLCSEPFKSYLLVALVLTTVFVDFYLLVVQPYAVQTKVVFVITDGKNVDGDGSLTVRELSTQQNPGVASLVSNRVAQKGDSLSFAATSIDSSTLKKNLLKNPKDFESWVSKLVSFDPDLRQAIDGHARAKSTVAVLQRTDNSVKEKSDQRLDEKIKQLDALRYEYQMALNRMNSGGGSFSPLALDSNNPASATLTRFQYKIIQLEIERGELNSRYTPKSREMRTIDSQIKEVKNLMKKYLVEQIEFVEKDRAFVVAQKIDLESADTRKAEQPKSLVKPIGLPVNEAELYLLNGGLSVINDPPSDAERSFLEKLNEAKESFVSRFFFFIHQASAYSI